MYDKLYHSYVLAKLNKQTLEMNKILFFITIVNHTHIEVEPSMKLNSIELLYGKKICA